MSRCRWQETSHKKTTRCVFLSALTLGTFFIAPNLLSFSCLVDCLLWLFYKGTMTVGKLKGLFYRLYKIDSADQKLSYVDSKVCILLSRNHHTCTICSLQGLYSVDQNWKTENSGTLWYSVLLGRGCNVNTNPQTVFNQGRLAMKYKWIFFNGNIVNKLIWIPTAYQPGIWHHILTIWELLPTSLFSNMFTNVC